MAAAVDKARGPVGPSLADLAIGSPVPFPVVQPPRASDVRAGFLGLYIAPVNKQPAPAYLLNRTVNVKGVPRHSTERWYWSVTLNAVTAAQQTTATQMHLPCRVTLSEDCGLVAGEGGFFVARFAYRLGSKHWCLDLAVGSEEGGLLARAGSIAFKQVLSWDVQGEGFFSEAWHAMRGHVSTFRASALGGDVIDPEVVSDGEVTDGGKSDGGRSDRSARNGTAKGKKRAAKDSNPPAPPKKLAGKGNAAAPQKAALGSPLREPGSPGTVPMIVYREACRDRDQFRQERDAARLATEAATRLKEELDTVKRQRDDLQAKLVDPERQGAATEARLEVLQRSKGWKHIESGPGAASPSQSGVPVAPPATYSARSMQFLASGLLEYAHLATRLMADAKSSCQQLQTIAGLARTTTMPDLSVDSLPKVEAEVSTRLQNADRRYRSDVVAAAQQPGWEPDPVVGSPGSLPGTAALR